MVAWFLNNLARLARFFCRDFRVNRLKRIFSRFPAVLSPDFFVSIYASNLRKKLAKKWRKQMTNDPTSPSHEICRFVTPNLRQMLVCLFTRLIHAIFRIQARGRWTPTGPMDHKKFLVVEKANFSWLFHSFLLLNKKKLRAWKFLIFPSQTRQRWVGKMMDGLWCRKA